MKQHKFYQQVMGVILGGLLLVGCATSATLEPTMEPTVEPTVEPTHEPTVEPTESAPVGATVGILDQGKEFVEMYAAPHPSAAVFATITVDKECIVVSGPRTVEDVTFWKLDCMLEDAGGEYHLNGWIDVTMLEVID